MIPLLRDLRNQRVALDTMAFIHAFEEDPTYLPLVRPLFHAIERGEMEAATSTLTVTECLVQPYRKQDMVLAVRYMVLFRNFPHLTVLPVTDQIGERAAFIRAHYHLRTPDAIQLATAIVSESHAFLTNDESLPRVEGTKVLVLDRYLK